jgi:hypothetical protein
MPGGRQAVGQRLPRHGTSVTIRRLHGPAEGKALGLLTGGKQRQPHRLPSGRGSPRFCTVGLLRDPASGTSSPPGSRLDHMSSEYFLGISAYHDSADCFVRNGDIAKDL